MIPIRDTAPCHTKPYVTWGLILFCTSLFILLQFIPEQLHREILYKYGMVPLRYSNPQWAANFGLLPDGYLSFFTNLFFAWWMATPDYQYVVFMDFCRQH